MTQKANGEESGNLVCDVYKRQPVHLTPVGSDFSGDYFIKKVGCESTRQWWILKRDTCQGELEILQDYFFFDIDNNSVFLWNE